MNRRSFLKVLGAGVAATAAAATLDPERLLWVPGARTFFIPDAPRITQRMIDAICAPNRTLFNSQFVTADWVAAEALKQLEKQLAFASRINRHYDANYGGGKTIRVNLPLRFSDE